MASNELDTPHCFSVFFNRKILAISNPKKKDHSGMGCSLMSQSMAKDRLKMAVMIPKKRTVRNSPLILLQKDLIPSFFRLFRFFRLMESMD